MNKKYVARLSEYEVKVLEELITDGGVYNDITSDLTTLQELNIRLLEGKLFEPGEE